MELSSISIAITSLVGALFSPGAMFTTGVSGAWYDPSDINLTWRRNLLTYTEQFDNAAWVKVNATVTANAVTAPDGTVTADLITENTANSQHSLYETQTVNAGQHTYTVYGKQSVGSRYLTVYPQAGSVGWCIFDLNTGSMTATGGGGFVSSSISAAGDGWYRCAVTFTAASGTCFAVCYLTNSASTPSTTYTGDGTSGIYIWGAQLEVGSTATPYQRITDGIKDYLQYQAQPVLFQDAAGTTPVTAVGQPVGRILDKSGRGNHAFNPSGNSANFPVLQQDGTGRYYLAFNGVNQWLQTNNIDFTYGDKMFVSAGVRKLSDATQMLLELSSDFNNGSVSLYSYTNDNKYYWNSKGTISSSAASSAITSPITNILSGIGSIGNVSGDQSILRVNGSQAAINTTYQGAGNYGNYPLYIGARAGSSLFFNGRLYGTVVAGKQASASEIASTEAWLNQKTGAY